MTIENYLGIQTGQKLKLCDEEINIEALLSCAFARSMKMMRYIDKVYDTNKEYYYKAAQRSSRFNSRFITGTRIGTQMRAIKALGIIMESYKNDDIKKALLREAERAYKQIVNVFNSYKGYPVPVDPILEASGSLTSTSDDMLHDTMAVYYYFLKEYNMEPDLRSLRYVVAFNTVQGKELASLKPFSSVIKDNCTEIAKSDKSLKEAIEKVIKKYNIKNLGEAGTVFLPNQPEFSFYQIMWDLAQLDNIPMSMFENEEFSSSEIKDIVSIIVLGAYRYGENFSVDDGLRLYIVGLMIRSFARLYHEATGIIDKYAGIVRENQQLSSMAHENEELKSKVAERKVLLDEKQNRLNTLQLRCDKADKKIMELEEELAAQQERVKILEQLLEEDSAPEPTAEDHAEYMEKGRKVKAVVFGGHPNWQSEVRNSAPKYTCISADNNNFDAKLIDKADVVVIKTDYMAHAQWYKIMSRAKKRRVKIIFCAGSVDNMLEKVGREMMKENRNG